MSESTNSPKKRLKNPNFNPKDGIPFSKSRQPSPKAKSDGWNRKRRGQELVKYILEQKFIGAADGNLKREIAAYYGCKESDITNEMAILFRQAQKAISKTDTPAAKLVLERGHGAPKQEIESSGGMNITITRKIIDTENKPEPDVHSAAE